jgi:hypothetical protein
MFPRARWSTSSLSVLPSFSPYSDLPPRKFISTCIPGRLHMLMSVTCHMVWLFGIRHRIINSVLSGIFQRHVSKSETDSATEIIEWNGKRSQANCYNAMHCHVVANGLVTSVGASLGQVQCIRSQCCCYYSVITIGPHHSHVTTRSPLDCISTLNIDL